MGNELPCQDWSAKAPPDSAPLIRQCREVYQYEFAVPVNGMTCIPPSMRVTPLPLDTVKQWAACTCRGDMDIVRVGAHALRIFFADTHDAVLFRLKWSDSIIWCKTVRRSES